MKNCTSFALSPARNHISSMSSPSIHKDCLTFSGCERIASAFNDYTPTRRNVPLAIVQCKDEEGQVSFEQEK